MTSFKTPSRLMAGIITLVLLSLFGFVLLAPIILSKPVEFDATLVQTLITLTVLAVSFYISSTNSSQSKDDTIVAQAKAAAAAPPPGKFPPNQPDGTVADDVAK